MTNVSEELARLAKLRDEGILTEEEFEAQKGKVLSGDFSRGPAPSLVKPVKAKGGVGVGKVLGIGCLGLIVVFIVLAVIGSQLPKNGAAGNMSAASNPEQAATEAPTAVTAKEVASAYKDNEASAQGYYGDKLLLVSATVEKVSLDFMDKPFVQLDTGDFIPANAALGDGSKDKASSLHKGNKIKLLCKGVTEVISIPQFKDCEIQ